MRKNIFIFIFLVFFNFTLFPIYENEVLKDAPHILPTDFREAVDLLASANSRFNSWLVLKNVVTIRSLNTTIAGRIEIKPDFQPLTASFLPALILIIFIIFYLMSRTIAGVEPALHYLDSWGTDIKNNGRLKNGLGYIYNNCCFCSPRGRRLLCR